MARPDGAGHLCFSRTLPSYAERSDRPPGPAGSGLAGGSAPRIRGTRGRAGGRAAAHGPRQAAAQRARIQAGGRATGADPDPERARREERAATLDP
ncbi:hypothetical protein GCM10010922_14080 [Microbacterium sorbitolivorans]|nr:hypothetical protein GCM10010922_14080 [Microbacterium sorbitolivorans]